MESQADNLLWLTGLEFLNSAFCFLRRLNDDAFPPITRSAGADSSMSSDIESLTVLVCGKDKCYLVSVHTAQPGSVF